MSRAISVRPTMLRFSTVVKSVKKLLYCTMSGSVTYAIGKRYLIKTFSFISFVDRIQSLCLPLSNSKYYVTECKEINNIQLLLSLASDKRTWEHLLVPRIQDQIDSVHLVIYSTPQFLSTSRTNAEPTADQL